MCTFWYFSMCSRHEFYFNSTSIAVCVLWSCLSCGNPPNFPAIDKWTTTPDWVMSRRLCVSDKPFSFPTRLCPRFWDNLNENVSSTSFLCKRVPQKTTKTDKHMLVFFDKARMFVIYFYRGFSRLRINLPTKLCRFRQAFVASNKRLSFPTRLCCFRQALCRKIASSETG